MRDAAAANESTSASETTLPLLHPAPGRCILRIVPRLLEATTEAGIVLQGDGRYQSQPMVGQLVEIGDPRTPEEKVIADWAIGEHNAGRYFIFSTYGAGSPYWEDDMRKMMPLGYDFTWLKGYRLFDTAQLACTVEGSGIYGEHTHQTKSGLIIVEN